MRHGSLFALGLAALLVAGASASAVGPTLSHYWDYEEVVATDNTAPIDTARLYVEGSDSYTDQSLSLVIGATNAPTAGRGGTGVALHTYNGCEYQAVGMGSMQSPDFTLEEWVQWNASGSGGWGNIHTYWAGPVHMQWGNGALTVGVGGTTYYSGAMATPAAGSWSHVAVVADMTAGTVTTYITGEGQSTLTVFAQNQVATYAGVSTGDFMLSSPNKNKYAANVAFDWTAIWDSALTEGTLTDHYLNGLNLHLRGSGPSFHPGDANGDGAVDLQDFGLLKENFGIEIGGGALWAQGDFNADGGIDLQDFGILKDHFGHTTGSVPVTAVPEPATMSLLALAGLGLIRRKR